MNRPPPRNTPSPWDALRPALHAYEAAAARWLAEHRAAGGRVYCGAGCFACCSMPVRVSLLEAQALAGVLSEEQWTAVRAQAGRVLTLAGALPETADYAEEHRRTVGFCALLRGGRCSAYERRPIRCRDTYSALPARHCEPGVPGTLPPPERRAYRREVRRLAKGGVGDGTNHFIAPLERLSEPAWEHASAHMRAHWGFEVWGELSVMLSLAADPQVTRSLHDGERALTRALRRSGLWHPEVVEVL